MMARLAWAGLRARRAGLLGAFVALLCSAALLTACATLLQTGLLGTVATERYAATPVLVSADQSLHFTKSDGKVKAKPLTDHAWLDDSIADRLATVPGGAGAVPELSFSADIVIRGGVSTGPSGHSWAHGWSSAELTPFTLTRGRPPSADNEVVVDATLAQRFGLVIGGSVAIETPTGRSSYEVVGVTRQSLPHEATLFFADDRARDLAAHPHQVFALALPRARAADLPGLRIALSGANAKLVTGAGRGMLEFTGTAKSKATLVSLSAALGGTALVAAMLVVAATFALSIGQRRRELALLRAIGATPRQLRRMIGAEALLVGLVAAGAGSAAGIALAAELRRRFVALHAIPPNMALQRGILPISISFVLTVLTGWCAARVCARRTVAIKPAHALVESAVGPATLGRFRLAAGLAATAGFVGLLQVLAVLHTDAAASPVSYVATLLALGSISLLGPALARLATAALSFPIRLFSAGVGQLAAANNRTNSQRLASVMTPLALAVAMTGPIAFGPTTLEHAADVQRLADVRADAVVTPAGPGLTSNDVTAVRSARGVSAANVELRSTLRIGQDQYRVVGMTPSAIAQTVDLGVRSGSIDRLGDDGVAVSTRAAAQHHLRLGQQSTLTLPDGAKTSLTVLAVYTQTLAFGDVVLSADLLARHLDNPRADDVLVRTENPAALTAAVASSGAHVVSPTHFTAAIGDAQRTNAEIGYLAWVLVVGFAAIAAVNGLAMATAGRSREFATLRIVGMTKRQVRRMVSLETTAVAGIALVLGGGVGYAVLLAYSRGMTPGHGPQVPGAAIIAILAAVAALATAATALPAQLSLNADPARTHAAGD